ncbi:FdhD protein [Rhodopseudomonas thermotolerans]|uniref:Sulfur carrier protein FdhD n=2 Tax=Rhodopseudomonas TaxID=1073 RepID=A0A336JN17_9BRAD|nr:MULTISPECIES: formate dehydrogenase accessory sulfurtransferase FdhD [Rhodopseudomonas]RED38423.1 FdhD protein [Rhodopseudomonas pentothenatexigens]REG06008.1 FdhD protein [Rhodopseudomonas thermotolerans]SSW89876.1 FdhD protein [Rhodopseudomonas pentothenatexigens]
MTRSTVHTGKTKVWRHGRMQPGTRAIPEETPIALSYNGSTQAVMMATPADLEDFAVGFSLSEGVIERPAQIESFEIVPHDDGVELRMWIGGDVAERLAQRRRAIAGPTGCGLCGVDSIAEAVRPVATVGTGRSFSPQQIIAAIEAMPPLQTLNVETRAVHAAAFFTPESGIVDLREDVGRHNALDKLAGALARGGIDATDGIVLLTSRVSVEMVQKTAAIGAPVLVAVSVPTALAVRMAEAAGITLAAIARSDGFELFSHPQRIVEIDHKGAADVA